MTRPKTFETYMRDTKNTFVYGVQTHQYHSDLWLWEKWFIANPIKTLIELGTGSGGLSMFFRLHAIQYDWFFMTFDIEVPQAIYENLWALLGMSNSFVKGDIFGSARKGLELCIEQSAHPIMLYCDNGDKPREVKEFGKLLHKNDFIAVHDWGTEFVASDIPANTYEEIFTDVSEVCVSRTRWMRKKI